MIFGATKKSVRLKLTLCYDLMPSAVDTCIQKATVSNRNSVKMHSILIYKR